MALSKIGGPLSIAHAHANAAFAAANSAGGGGNLSAGSYANSAFLHANSAFAAANSAGGGGDASAGTYANGSFLQANSAFLHTNLAFTHANSAFAAANSAGGGGISNVVEDTTPQLGGNLDVQDKEINTSTTNGNIVLNPDGTGVVEIKGDGSSNDGALQLNCYVNSHGVKLKSPPHSAGQSYTTILPDNDITADKFLKVKSITGSGTTAVGQLEFADQIANLTITTSNTEVTNVKVFNATHVALGSVSGAVTINTLTGTYFSAESAGAITWTFQNQVDATKATAFTLELTAAGSYTQTWPASVKWPGGSAPTLTSGAAKVDVLVFITDDGGTTWRGAASILDSS